MAAERATIAGVLSAPFWSRPRELDEIGHPEVGEPGGLEEHRTSAAVLVQRAVGLRVVPGSSARTIRYFDPKWRQSTHRSSDPTAGGTGASPGHVGPQPPHRVRLRAMANAVCEGFFAALDLELIDRTAFRTRREAPFAVFEFIEERCNIPRRPSALGHRSPVE